jgi:hypothetical protein
MEFGVAEGDSNANLAALWGDRRSASSHAIPFGGSKRKFANAEVGTFACEPLHIPGVEIVEGYFEESLTPERAARVGRVAFASLDTDLYSATSCALK